MKSNIFHNLPLGVMLFVLSITSSCNKQPLVPIGKLPPTMYIPATQHEEPFNTLLWNLRIGEEAPVVKKETIPTFANDLTAPNVSVPEYGYSFSSSVAGIIDKLGVMLPDSGQVYTVSLWDSVTQKLMVQRNIEVQNPNAFNYLDLVPDNQSLGFQIIQANHPYIISVFLAPLIGESVQSSQYQFPIPADTPDGEAYVYVLYALGGPKGTSFITLDYSHVIHLNTGISRLIHPFESLKPEFPEGGDSFYDIYGVPGFCDFEFTYVQKK